MPPKKSKRKGPRKSRTLTERAEAIFRFIERQPGPFAKSELQEIGLNPSTADTWVRLIEYIQSQPRIRVTRMGSSTFIEKVENRYLSMLRKRLIDSGLSMKERSRTMEDYISALVTLELIEEGRIKK
jgi:hypothetical protein